MSCLPYLWHQHVINEEAGKLLLSYFAQPYHRSIPAAGLNVHCSSAGIFRYLDTRIQIWTLAAKGLFQERSHRVSTLDQRINFAQFLLGECLPAD